MFHHSKSRQPDSREAPVRLVCLPFAGGGSAPIFRWRRALPAFVELVPMSLPGHDGRLNERPFTDLCKLANTLVDEFQPSSTDKPFILLGHSMGAWLAFEMSRELRRRGARMPELLIVAASRAPHLPANDSPIHALADEQFLTALERRYGPIAPDVSGSPELMRLLLPALRADIQMVETYRYSQEPPLDTEILAMGGSDDAAISPAHLEGWRRHAARACSVRLLPGGHFFLFDAIAARPTGTTRQAMEPSPAWRMIVARIEQFWTGPPTGCDSVN
jgi:surfactin synthase thioesterase subunit